MRFARFAVVALTGVLEVGRVVRRRIRPPRLSRLGLGDAETRAGCFGPA